jgi:hypothetical protein
MIEESSQHEMGIIGSDYSPERIALPSRRIRFGSRIPKIGACSRKVATVPAVRKAAED